MLGSLRVSLARYARLMRLDKPIGIWLLLWPTLWAQWIASAGHPRQSVFIVLVLGTIVMRSAGCVFNDFADRNFDGRVERTANRPLAAGEVAPGEALILFVGLLLIALGLVLTLNRLALVYAFGGAAITIFYPFTKRFLPAPQFVLGVAFAFGVPIAYAAEIDAVPRVAWVLFIANILWVLVYDTQYAMVDRDDDMKIGLNSTAILLGDMDRFFIAALHVLLVMTFVLVGRSAELGAWYFAAVALCAALALRQLYLIRDRERDACFRAFLSNAWFGGTLFAGICLNYIFSS